MPWNLTRSKELSPWPLTRIPRLLKPRVSHERSYQRRDHPIPRGRVLVRDVSFMYVSAVLLVHEDDGPWPSSTYQSRGESSAEFWFLKYALLAHDALLAVGVLGTHRMGSG